MPLIIEIKAHCRQPEKIHRLLMESGARFAGTDRQLDTYFFTPHGRLKLREGNIENQLIYYLRENQAGPKKSEVLLYPMAPGSTLKALFSAALGVKAVVDKTRRIYFIGNVKFHLDKVKGLGSFLEIEAIDNDGSTGLATLDEQCRYYLDLLEVKPEELLTGSYSDMLMVANRLKEG